MRIEILFLCGSFIAMKKILAFASFMILCSCYQQERNCTDFKEGTFKSEITIEGKTYTSVFTRTKDLQIETYDGRTDSSSVRWINDCEVIFHTLNPKRMIDKKDVHLKILSTTADSYTFEYSYVVTNAKETIKQRGKATKID